MLMIISCALLAIGAFLVLAPTNREERKDASARLAMRRREGGALLALAGCIGLLPSSLIGSVARSLLLALLVVAANLRYRKSRV